MIVDQVPLVFTPIHPLPSASWPAADTDRFGREAPASNRACEDEPPNGPSGWPRIFPGL